MGQTIDYNQIAGVYAQTRTAAPWIVTWLAEQIRDLPAGDLTQYATSIDEPKLQSQVTDYKRTDLKTMTVNNQAANNQVIIELTYSSTSAPDPVTNKTRAVISQRYYIPGPNNRLAILTLTTPDGVDNVDAFRQMLESFSWQ